MFTKEQVVYRHNSEPTWSIHCYNLSNGKWWAEIHNTNHGYSSSTFAGGTEKEVFDLAANYLENLLIF